MFTVSGYIGGVAYDVTVADGEDAITGTPNVLGLLESNAGTEIAATPTGPFLTLTLTDTNSVYAALLALTEVRETSGDTPDLFGPTPLGAVF